MRLPLSRLLVGTMVVAVAGCSDDSMTTKPSISAPTSLRADKSGDHSKTVRMMDECDPTTFNAAFGPGTCERKGGGVKLDHFISQLTHLQRVPEWKFAPDNVNIRVGDVLAAFNAGGEVHTFT